MIVLCGLVLVVLCGVDLGFWSGIVDLVLLWRNDLLVLWVVGRVIL